MSDALRAAVPLPLRGEGELMEPGMSGNRWRLNSRTLVSLALLATLAGVGLVGASGCGTGIYQDFTDAISGCCCDDDCDECDDCGDWGYDDCYWGDCGGCYYGDCGDWGFDLGFGWFEPWYPVDPYW